MADITTPLKTTLATIGEVGSVVIGENIRYVPASTPEATGMFLKIGANGLTALHRIPDQDIHWIDEDTTSFPVTTTAQVLVSTPVDQEILASDGSYSFSCQLDNTENQATNVTITARVEGTAVGAQVFSLDKSETNKYIIFSGGLSSDISSGDIIDFTIFADDTGVNVRGDLVVSRMDITKAQAAPVTSSKLLAKGLNPVALLEVEPGGLAGAVQIFDMEAPIHLVASMEWIKSTQQVIWALNDKDSGVIKAMLQLKPDGTAHIGSGMVQHKIATEVDTQALHDDIMTVAKVAIQKANKTALPTIFSGSTIPLDTLGKDLDWYHHFEAGSIITKDLYVSDCREDYHPNYTTLAAIYQGDTPQNSIAIVELAPSNNTLFIDLTTSDTLPVEELTLEITNYGYSPVVIPITVISNSAGSFTGSYSTTFDTLVQSILGVDGGSINPSTFKITVKEGVQTPAEHDYQKHNGVWLRADFLNTEEVNDLIRSYNTVVTMVLADQKKPTRAEAITASKTLPNFDWTKNDTFYIRDTGGGNKMVFCTYISDGAVDEATAGPYFFKDMNECI